MKTKKTKQYRIEGMHCSSCAMMVEGELEDRGLTGRCSFAQGTVEIDGDDATISDDVVREAVEAAGYAIKSGK